MKIALPPLPYEYDALEPVISAATMKLHHGAHRGYVDRLNALIRGSEFEGASLETIVKRSSGSVFNNAAQAWNHAFFWNSLRPQKARAAPCGALAERFAEPIKAAAAALFGSGWVWLVEDGGILKVTATSNADTPLVHGQKPLLVLAVWEHAYYLDRQNRRDLYAAAVIDHLSNWEFAERNLLSEEAAHAA